MHFSFCRWAHYIVFSLVFWNWTGNKNFWLCLVIQNNSTYGMVWCVIVLLDLKAAFDTVDHGMLLDRVEKLNGALSNSFSFFQNLLLTPNSHVHPPCPAGPSFHHRLSPHPFHLFLSESHLNIIPVPVFSSLLQNCEVLWSLSPLLLKFECF